jgi:hypothetical protein
MNSVNQINREIGNSCFERASNFFRRRPAARILVDGIFLLAVSELISARRAFMIGIGGLAVLPAGVEAAERRERMIGRAAAIIGATAGAAEEAGGMPAGVALAAIAGSAGMFTAAFNPRASFSVGTTVSSLVGASVLVNGGGLAAALMLPAVTAGAFLATKRWLRL